MYDYFLLIAWIFLGIFTIHPKYKRYSNLHQYTKKMTIPAAKEDMRKILRIVLSDLAMVVCMLITIILLILDNIFA